MPVMSRPRRNTRPREGLITPAIMLNSVVLPAPFGPRTARSSSEGRLKCTSWSATSPPNRTVTPSTRRSLRAKTSEAGLAMSALPPLRCLAESASEPCTAEPGSSRRQACRPELPRVPHDSPGSPPQDGQHHQAEQDQIVGPHLAHVELENREQGHSDDRPEQRAGAPND